MILAISVWIVSSFSSFFPSLATPAFSLFPFLLQSEINQLVLYITKSQPQIFNSELYNQRKTKWAHHGTPLDHLLLFLLPFLRPLDLEDWATCSNSANDFSSSARVLEQKQLRNFLFVPLKCIQFLLVFKIHIFFWCPVICYGKVLENVGNPATLFPA